MMAGYHSAAGAPREEWALESLRLEAVTTCVGFDDILDATLSRNRAQVDTMIVITTHEDWRTQSVANKHDCLVVPTDLFAKNGRKFNKGAAINAGMDYWQYHGWRLHLDADIALPDHTRRVLFNHTHLEQDCLYGADRMDLIGQEVIDRLLTNSLDVAQHSLNCRVDPTHGRRLIAPIGSRLVHSLEGYTPLGFFQMWHASTQKKYPYSLGTAAHDDTMFACLWPLAQRRLLPSLWVYHLCADNPVLGQHWNGNSAHTRLKGWGCN